MRGGMVELVDTTVSNTVAARRGGSIPSAPILMSPNREKIDMTPEGCSSNGQDSGFSSRE